MSRHADIEDHRVGSEMLLDQLWPMAQIGTATLLLAGWLFRHRMY